MADFNDDFDEEKIQEKCEKVFKDNGVSVNALKADTTQGGEIVYKISADFRKFF